MPKNQEDKMKKVAGYFLFIMLVVSLMVSGCYQVPTSAPPPPPPQGMPTPGAGTVHQVTIKDFAFSPGEITIKVGNTVTWTQQDPTHHTTTGNIWDSGDLGRGQTYSQTFDKTGNYDYRCNYHPAMKGRVIVE